MKRADYINKTNDNKFKPFLMDLKSKKWIFS